MRAAGCARGVLTHDRTSRLTKLLVYDRQLATSVSAGRQPEDEGYFRITVNPRPGVSLTTIEQLVDSVLAGLQAAPPSAREVDRAKRYALVGTVTSLEAADARAEILAQGQTYLGDPEHYAVDTAAGAGGDASRRVSGRAAVSDRGPRGAEHGPGGQGGSGQRRCAALYERDRPDGCQ